MGAFSGKFHQNKKFSNNQLQWTRILMRVQIFHNLTGKEYTIHYQQTETYQSTLLPRIIDPACVLDSVLATNFHGPYCKKDRPCLSYPCRKNV